jgi:cell division protein FtsL
MLRYTDKTDILDLDLRLFDVEEKDKEKQDEKLQKRAEKFKDPNSSLSKKGNWIVWVFLAACALAVFFIYSSGKIELDRVNAQSSVVALRLDEAMRENVRLQAELEALATPAKIEEYAARNGLIREQVSQVTHITVNVERSIEVAEARNNDILSIIGRWFNDILEFLGF